MNEGAIFNERKEIHKGKEKNLHKLIRVQSDVWKNRFMAKASTRQSRERTFLFDVRQTMI